MLLAPMAGPLFVEGTASMLLRLMCTYLEP